MWLVFGCQSLFRLFIASNAVKLTHVMLYSLACDTMKFGCFPKCCLAMRLELVKQPVYSTTDSKPCRLGGPPSLIRVRGERVH